MRQVDNPGPASILQPAGAGAALFALATALMLQSTRAFVSYLVFVVDQSQRTTIAMIALAVFAFPLSCWLLVRLNGPQRVLAASVLLLTLSRFGLQVIEQPVIRLAAGGTGLIAWGVLAILLLAANRQSAAAGLILGFAVDLALRTANGPLDLAWTPGPAQTIQVAAVITLMVALWWRLRDDLSITGASWRSAAALITIGPTIALFHFVTGNIAFVSTHTGFSTGQASTLLAGGILLGSVIGVLRLMAINLGAGGGALVSRFVIFDAMIGGIALSLAWGGDSIAWLGIFFVTVTATELLLFALAGFDGGPNVQIGPVAVFTTIGLLVQFILFFTYYTATGSGLILGLAWLVIVAGALTTVFALPSSLQRHPLDLRQFVAPAVVAVLLLGASIAWAGFGQSTPTGSPGANGTVQVISYNIQSGFSRDNYWDLEATARVIEGSGADIVILQEVSRGWLVTTGNDQLAWLSDRLDMPYAWGPASSDDLWGNAVLSRFPITSETVVRFDSTQNLKRSALFVELDLGDGLAITIIATHLDNPDEASQARSEQVDQLAGLLTFDRPTILAGDFNMTPDDPLIQEVIAAGLVDVGVAANADEGTSEDGRRIDYIFVTPDFGILAGEVIDSDASDHRPMTATLELP
ncbi:hypothetical protein BH23CHL2_BH23CHL2_25240 [soil metagenome]